MKVGKKKKKQNPSIFLATYWKLFYKSGDLEKEFLSKSGEFGSFFSHEKSNSSFLWLDLHRRQQILELHKIEKINLLMLGQ
jgi:hypothetical protein